jgi:hypothetical protein
MTASSNPSKRTSSIENPLLLTREFVRSGRNFEEEAKRILATHESSKSRTITIEQTYSQLATLSVKQDRLLKQSLECTGFSLFRAAHVLAWGALMDFLEEKLAMDNFVSLNKVRDKWKIRTVHALRDTRSDYQIIGAVEALEFCTMNEEKALKALLTQRNECAHPGDYEPDLNETLGYVSQVLKRIGALQKRWSKS